MIPLRWMLFFAQVLLGVRVIARMLRTSGGRPLATAESTTERSVVLLPVLNEQRRLGPCLDGLLAQGPEVEVILVIDGGSTDGTRALVEAAAARDERVRLITADPPPEGANGKAWQLQAGVAHVEDAPWVLTVDADVRPQPGLVAAMLERAAADRADLLSLGARQRVADPIDAMLHPAMLTTLVYRFGIPGNVARSPEEAQANGQCFLIRRELLDRVGGFEAVLHEIAEDVALARMAARSGARVAFVEAGDLATTEMYASWRETWHGWLRSLPLLDGTSEREARTGLWEVTLVQAAPLPLLIFWRWRGFRLGALVNLVLLITRIGTLAGTQRAYERPPAAYWLSPVTDLPVAVGLWLSAVKRQHSWRGRTVRRGRGEPQ